jgi:phosphate/sulfate permease
MEQIRNYFTAEKNESILFIVIGVTAFLVSIYFLLSVKKIFHSGMAYPIMAIALIQIIVGSSVYIRSPKDIARVEQMISSDKTKIGSEEIPRMDVVMKNFIAYRWIEIALIISGLILMFAFANNDLLKGIGIGLFIQSSIMLSLDFFAEKRGMEYLNYLHSLVH